MRRHHSLHNLGSRSCRVRALRLRTLLFAGSILLTGLDPCSAQDTSTPESAAVAYMEASRAADWLGAASLMHSDALRDIRGLLEALLERPDGATFGAMLFNGKTPDAIAALPDEAYFAAFVTFALAQTPGAAAILASSQMDVVGTVMEGPTAHVVVRMTVAAEGIEVKTMEVHSFRQQGGQWRALLQGDLSNMVASLRAVLGGAR